MVNYDETLIKIMSEGHYVYESASKCRSHSLACVKRVLGSFLPFICASGKVICTFWITKGVEDSIQNVVLPREVKCGWKWFWVFTQTGYVNIEAFTNCMKKFTDVWKESPREASVGLWR